MSDWVVVAGDFMPHGGMDRANHALAMTLSERSPRGVTLVAHRVAADLERPGVTIARVPRPLGSHLLGAPLLARAGAQAVRQLPAGGRSVVNGGNVENNDVNWVHYVHSAYTPVAQGVRRRAQTFVSRRYDLARERRSLARARVIVCNSRMTAADVAEHAGGNTRVTVVYYGTDPATFSYVDAEARRAARLALGWDPARPVAIFIGALGDRRKGFDRLLEAWHALAASGSWDADLVVVGAGSELPAWERRAAGLGLTARVRFLGFRTDVPQLLAASDLLVHPSRYEAYGLGVHEAICRGLTAIVSANAGIAERYPESLRHWLIPDVEDASDIAARIRRWRGDPGAAAAGMQGFSDTLRARTWRDMADEFIEAVA